MEARGHILRYTKEDNAKARKLFEEVVALDPNYTKPIWVSQSATRPRYGSGQVNPRRSR